jgi:hypothetical protein
LAAEINKDFPPGAGQKPLTDSAVRSKVTRDRLAATAPPLPHRKPTAQERALAGDPSDVADAAATGPTGPAAATGKPKRKREKCTGVRHDTRVRMRQIVADYVQGIALDGGTLMCVASSAPGQKNPAIPAHPRETDSDVSSDDVALSAGASTPLLAPPQAASIPPPLSASASASASTSTANVAGSTPNAVQPTKKRKRADRSAVTTVPSVADTDNSEGGLAPRSTVRKMNHTPANVRAGLSRADCNRGMASSKPLVIPRAAQARVFRIGLRYTPPHPGYSKCYHCTLQLVCLRARACDTDTDTDTTLSCSRSSTGRNGS